MKSWICMNCGSTAISKCPSERNVFPGMEHAVWSSILYTDVIRGKEGRREVIFTVTDFLGKNEKKSDSQIVLDVLNRMHEAKDAISNAICDHHWVINSETECTCSLGHTHNNLTTYAPAESVEEPWTAENMIKSFDQPIKVLLEQCRIMLNVTKNSFDNYAEEQNYHIKHEIRDLLWKYAKGENVLPPYKAVIYHGYNDPRNRRVPFHSEESLDTFVKGYHMQGFGDAIKVEKYSLDSLKYEEIDWNLEVRCPYCKKPVDLSLGSLVHARCQVKHEKRSKETTAWYDMPLPKELEDLYYKDGVDIWRNLAYHIRDSRFMRKQYGNFDIEDAVDGERYISIKRNEHCRRVIRVKVRGTWYVAQELRTLFLEN